MADQVDHMKWLYEMPVEDLEALEDFLGDNADAFAIVKAVRAVRRHLPAILKGME